MLTGRHSIASVSTFSLPISFHPHLVAVSEMAVNNLIFGSDGEAETAQRKSSQTWPPFRIKGVCDRCDLVNLVASSCRVLHLSRSAFVMPQPDWRWSSSAVWTLRSCRCQPIPPFWSSGVVRIQSDPSSSTLLHKWPNWCST